MCSCFLLVVELDLKRSGWPTLLAMVWSPCLWLLGHVAPYPRALQTWRHVVSAVVCWLGYWAGGTLGEPAAGSVLGCCCFAPTLHPLYPPPGCVCPCAAFALDLEPLQWQSCCLHWMASPCPAQLCLGSADAVLHPLHAGMRWGAHPS